MVVFLRIFWRRMLGGMLGVVFIVVVLPVARMRAHCWGLGAIFRGVAGGTHDLKIGRDSRYL